jgi:5-methylcytosine-specific restriction protein A
MSPMAPRRPCGWPMCPKYSVPGKPRCEAHQVEYFKRRNAERDPAVQAFYNSTAWKALRRVKMAMTPYCECDRCKAKGLPLPAQQVDHREPVALRPDLALVLENLQSLSMSCHSRKTMTDQNRQRNR